MPHILQRVRSIGGVYLGNAPLSIMVTDTEAAYSFVLELYAAAIFFDSRAVEMAINMDSRMQEQKSRSDREWLNLTLDVLKDARDQGLPVKLLLNTDEVEFDHKPIFVSRRNKIIHGDLEGYKEVTGFYRTTDFTKPYRLPVAPGEEDAYDQLTKSRKFRIQWTREGSTNIPKNARFVSEQDVL